MKHVKFHTPDSIHLREKARQEKFSPVIPPILPPKLYPIPGLPEYFASQVGDIYSKKKNPTYNHNKIPHRLTPYFSAGGAIVVKVTMPSGFQTQKSVGRLVALAFLGQPPSPNMRAYRIDESKGFHYTNMTWGRPRKISGGKEKIKAETV